MKFKALILAGALTTACSPSVVSPTLTTPKAVSIVVETETKHWPVQHPDGMYGHEDERYPPGPENCPVGWFNHYNNWNFVCISPSGERVFPK